MTVAPSPDHRLILPAFVLIGLIALFLTALTGGTSDTIGAPAIHRTAAAASPLMVSAPPAVEPLELLAMTPDRARAINAAIPFSLEPNLPARPFRLIGSDSDRERALTCLAAAVWYEAGDDAVGERAVAQVVLNRLRHPAYPGTVCGVVFQGSERKTGCQFTFTCDGSLARVPSIEAWKRARAIADEALSGSVDKAVGTATSYHTNWVVPYWSGTLEKITEVHTHLFFRWPGWWGQPAAFSNHYAGGELLDPRLTPLATSAAIDVAAVPGAPIAEGTIPPLQERRAIQVEGVPARSLKNNIVRLASDQRDAFGLELDPRAYAGDYAIAALALCASRPICIVAGWIRADTVPASLPFPNEALRTATFVYRKNRPRGPDLSLWNCRQVIRDNVAQCLPGTAPAPESAADDRGSTGRGPS